MASRFSIINNYNTNFILILIKGTLTIVHGSPEFPPGREILIYHRPTKDYNIRKEFTAKIGITYYHCHCHYNY